MLVDDHLVVRRGIEHVLADDPEFEIVAEMGDGAAAVAAYRDARPDVVLLDVRMPGLSGIDTARALLAEDPGARIIALSSFTTEDLIDAMMAAGVRGYLPKEVSETALKEALHGVARGESLARPPGSAAAPRGPETGDLAQILGTQQLKVLALMVKGLTNPEIAALLSITRPTARYHVSAILKKLDVSNRAEAVALAVRSGLVRDEDGF
ncbi:response regulator transcription factor [Pararhodobacter sp.]|uniref:response regulator transcription factor n=1 Tax=Pararhodobacter sp. TaxID=2127056 RepID=UPI002FE30C1A